MEGAYGGKENKVKDMKNELNTPQEMIIRDNKCGDNLSWSLNDGVLTINGTGGMFNFSQTSFPWYDNMDSILSIVIDDGVASIGDYACYRCINLKSVIIPDSIISIGNYSFYKCINLQTITIPNSVTSIEYATFCYCSNLSKVIIPDSVKTIKDYAFYNCNNINDIIIPSSVTSIGEYAFYNCISLKRIIILKGLTSIGCSSFYNCYSLTSITFPDGVKTIDFYAFYNCSSLTQVSIPESVTSIESNAFGNCKNISTVFYYGYKEFTTNAFTDCPINTICVPPGYNFTTIWGLSVTSNSSVCQSFQELNNICFIPIYEDDGFIMKKRKNATEWEKQSNGCIKYECDNESGFVSWSICNSSDGINRLCLNNDKCVLSNEIPEDKKAYVEIEVNDGVKVTDINITEIIDTINILCNISSAEIAIGYENDDYGNIIRVMIYIDDENKANDIADMMTKMSKNDDCNLVSICRAKNIRVTIVNDANISGYPRLHENKTLIVEL